MRLTKIRSFLASLAVVWALAPMATAEECTIREFGSHSFLRGSVSVTELQRLIAAHESEVRDALRRAGWDGDPAEFLRAVADGRVEERLYPIGQSFEWMMFRRAGQAVVVHQRCYGGDAPFAGWEIAVDSRGKRTTFAMPKVCGNIAMLHTEKLAEAKVEEVELAAEVKIPPQAICDLTVDEHHLEEEETLRVAVNVSDVDLVKEVQIEIQREESDRDEEGDSWTVVDRKTLIGPPYTWEVGLDKDGDYKLVAHSIGDGFRSLACEDRIEVD